MAIILAPEGNTQLILPVVTEDVATNFTGVPGQVCTVDGVIDKTGLGATTTVILCGELQNAPDVAVMV